MNATEVLRARVDRRLASRVHRWARRHDLNVSEAVRVALRRLVEEEEQARRVEEALHEFDAAAKAGLFDPPAGIHKGGGFR